MAKVYRAPMRSRRDDIDPQAAIDRALATGVVGFGDAGFDERTARRVERFADVADGSFAWTRDADGLFWLGRIVGPYYRDEDPAATAVDLVHVRPCRWLADPVTESDTPPAVLATYARGGRNFQQTHSLDVGPQTERVWHTRKTREV
ncbi:GAF domain-containing protein [Mycolicibacterium sp. GF69]|uniref:GAF domain-containing protein n=1 Tax=Mycolicibacterium sp. GF69 TaxID=2267251 RepID=UPI000DCDC040|nr:GAF domain-containing protein [Mycolicibacterium sp. GF69]RAV10650.1 GAF domain-containing protein [Mycolicibacterium sp. GF69]